MGVVKILSKEIIDEIIRLYSTGECCSKEIIGKKFGTSKRVVSRILEENNFDNISGMSLLASFMENVYLDAMGEKPIFVLNLDRLVKYLNTKIPF